MSFLNPIFLFALFTVAVPLLIYLLNIRKPKKIRFSTLAFFESLKTTALKRIKIKRWLLLAIRCSAILVLVLAVSRPFLPPEIGWGAGFEAKVVAIIIDNGPKMDQITREGPYLEQAVGIAETVIDMLGNGDRVTLDVTHGAGLNTPLLGRRPVRSLLNDIEISNAGNYADVRIKEMANRLIQESEPNKMIYFITEAGLSMKSRLEALSDEEIEDVFLQVVKVDGSDTVNLGFDRVELESSVGAQPDLLQLRVVVRNYGFRSVRNAFISLIMDDQLITQQTFSTETESTTEFVFEIPTSDSPYSAVELLIEGDDLAFDNRHYIAIKSPDVKNILVLHEAIAVGGAMNGYLRPMLEVAAEDESRFQIEFKQIENVQISDLNKYDGIVLDALRSVPDYLSQPLLDHVQDGAGLLLIPAATGNLSNYNRFIGFSGTAGYQNITGSYGSFNPVDRMAVPSDGHPIIDRLFDKPDDEELRLNLPELFYYFEISPSERSTDYSILNTRTGRPILMESRVGNGSVIYSAIGTDPGWSNFPIKPFFAPLFFRTIDYLARGETASLNIHYLGSEFVYVSGENVDTIELEKDGETILPELRQTLSGTELRYSGVEWVPGWLNLNTPGSNILVGVNQNTMESNLNTLVLTDLTEIIKESFQNVRVAQLRPDRAQFSDDLELASFGKEIWYWFVFIAIILLLLESIVSRSFKTETLR